jgi:hypothetical protein
MGAGNVETSCSSSVLNSIRLSFLGYMLYTATYLQLDIRVSLFWVL